MDNVPSQSLDLMTDDELVAAAAPFVRQLLLRDLLRGKPDTDGETFTVFLLMPENEAKAAQVEEHLRSLPPMRVLKDEIKH